MGEIMTENKALVRFQTMATKAAAGGFHIDSVEVNREGKTVIVFGLYEGSPVAHASFPLLTTWDNVERARIEAIFADAAERGQGKRTTAMKGIMVQKSVSLNRSAIHLDIKSLTPDRRVIIGIATSPTPDRQNDVIESLGCQFKNPIPLLWAHDSKMPVGKCFLLPPTDKGVEFKAEIADIKEEGALKARCDEAWQSVKAGLVTSVSIGFRPLDAGEPLRNGGRRYSSIEVMELSLVTIPANPDAKVLGTKMADQVERKVTEKVEEKVKEPVEKKVEPRAPGKGAVRLIPSSYKW